MESQWMMSYLSARDAILAKVITQTTLHPLEKSPEPYLALLQAIINQQLSLRAAEQIWQRLLERLGQDLTPQATLMATEDTLRTVGLSRQKINYLRAVAHYAQCHDFTHAALAALDDQTIIEQLTTIHGVGRWTAQMLLLFCLQRPDIFPIDDLAIQQAMQELYGLQTQRGQLLKQQLYKIAAQWAPYRAIACRYLWSWRNR